MNGLSKRKGFTLIELMIGLAIIGLLASITIPTLRGLLTKDNQEIFLSELNSLISNALDNAILLQKTNRIVFDFEKRKVFIQQEQDKKLKTGEIGYEKVSSRYVQSEFDFSKMDFEFKNFYIDTKDEMRLSINESKKNKVWFFILPDGISQPVILNIIDNDIDISEDVRRFSLVLNPFSVQFKYYEKFMQPS